MQTCDIVHQVVFCGQLAWRSILAVRAVKLQLVLRKSLKESNLVRLGAAQAGPGPGLSVAQISILSSRWFCVVLFLARGQKVTNLANSAFRDLTAPARRQSCLFVPEPVSVCKVAYNVAVPMCKTLVRSKSSGKGSHAVASFSTNHLKLRCGSQILDTLGGKSYWVWP